jgi:hypothetical protein
MTINGRLILLVIATGLFIHVWTTNDRSSRPRSRTVSKTRISAQHSTSPPNPVPTAPVRAVSSQPDLVVSSRIVPLEETWTETTCPIELPAGITSGTYRVVDDSGRVARLEIGGADFGPRETISTQSESYIMTAGARWWYFVRLQEWIELPPPGSSGASDEAAAETPETRSTTSVDSPAFFNNRKFDFGRYLP